MAWTGAPVAARYCCSQCSRAPQTSWTAPTTWATARAGLQSRPIPTRSSSGSMPAIGSGSATASAWTRSSSTCSTVTQACSASTSTATSITFRTTTKHSFSPANTWEVASLYGPNPKNLPVGISGEIVIPKGNAWVKYEITRSQRSLKEFNSIRIFYTNAKASAIKVYFNESTTPKVVNLVAGADLKELLVKCDAPSKSVKIEFPLADQAYFYGVSLENPVGLYVDNFPLRGNSGVDILKILPNTLKDYAKFVDYKLIVLEFGLNLAGKTDYSWYEREMGRVIGHLKTAYPKASILMISVHDKAVKQGSNFVTDPSVLRLLETQKNIATKNNVALFNLFEAMGGNNSMGKWVTANPPLASKDYVHFNIYGAKRVADMITQSLLDEFNKRK